MSIYSVFFNAAVRDGAEAFHDREAVMAADRAREERDDLFREAAGVETNKLKRTGDQANTAKAEQKRRDQEGQQQTALQAMLAKPEYRAAYDRFTKTADSAAERLAHLHRENADRMEWLAERLIDPNADLSVNEREAYEKELERRADHEARIRDAQNNIDGHQTRVEDGHVKDAKALDQLTDSIRDDVEALEREFEAGFTPPPRGYEHEGGVVHPPTPYTAPVIE